MVTPPNRHGWPGVDEVVEAYESALADGKDADVTDFVPPPEHPEQLAIICELVRVALEHEWENGQPRRLDDYRALFPAAFEHAALVRAMAFEEYRLRLQAGECPTPEEYVCRFGVNTEDWPDSLPGGSCRSVAAGSGQRVIQPVGAAGGTKAASRSQVSLRRQMGGIAGEINSPRNPRDMSAEQAELLRSFDRTDPHTAERLAEALAGLPRAGVNFLGFRLCGELGRGAFGRVFLAHQGDLADRLVALKVSADVAGETHALARLQHTNIVPIYSVHRQGPLQVVCMPYLGHTTLADTLVTLRSQTALPRSGEGLLSSFRARNGADASQRAEPEIASVVPPSAGSPEAGADVSRVPDAPACERLSPEVERLRSLPYVQAVLWIMARVADGLAHAHERGILHRDLKPANILFADYGEPILLDFNLALDTRVGVAATVALVGGTLPYMAPEHLIAFRDGKAALDSRSDVYSLGVIIYELLTGTHPFPIRTGSVESLLPDMIADRFGAVPEAREVNPAVSPAIAAIIRHCLEPDPDRRYRSARELHEDLRRQLDHLPLRHVPEPSFRERLGKWAARHPRLTSSASVGLVSALLLLAVCGGFLIRQNRFRRLEAMESFRSLSDEVRQADVLLGARGLEPRLIDEGIAVCRRALDRFQVLDNPGWRRSSLVTILPEADQLHLRQDIGWLLFLWARATSWQAESLPDLARRAERHNLALRLNALAQGSVGEAASPRAWWRQRADLKERMGKVDEAQRLRARAESAPEETPRERLLTFADKLGVVPRQEALPFLQEVSRREPQNFASWLRLGNFYVEMARLSGERSYLDEAEHCYALGIALRPDIYWAYLNRGLVYLETKDFPHARSDFDQVLAMRPDLAMAFINRALARIGMRDFQGAVDDLTRALAFKDAPTQALFIRSRARAAVGDSEGAARDRDEGLRRVPNDPVSWVVRGLAKLPVDPEGALADFNSALALNPRYDRALQNKARVLSEHFGRTEDAIRVLDEAVALHPGYVKALAGRGVLLARLGRREAAIHDARAVLERDDGALSVYQAACVFALTSLHQPGDRAEALRLLSDAVRKDGSWLQVAREDPDLAPLRDRPEFKELVQALQVVMRTGSSH
jgi:serine/threonine protein kinase/tetratricopeptide (TPR) repeat protein